MKEEKLNEGWMADGRSGGMDLREIINENVNVTARVRRWIADS